MGRRIALTKQEYIWLNDLVSRDILENEDLQACAEVSGPNLLTRIIKLRIENMRALRDKLKALA